MYSRAREHITWYDSLEWGSLLPSQWVGATPPQPVEHWFRAAVWFGVTLTLISQACIITYTV